MPKQMAITLALGRSAQASQTSATSLGSGSKSDGQNALAVGSLATASGNILLHWEAAPMQQ